MHRDTQGRESLQQDKGGRSPGLWWEHMCEPFSSNWRARLHRAGTASLGTLGSIQPAGGSL